MKLPKTFKKTTLVACACLVVGMLLTGCAANHPTSNQSTASQRVTMGIDACDLMSASNAAADSLLASGVFDRATRQPAVLAFGVFTNHTTQMVDLDLLTGQICAALVTSGKVVVSAKEQPADGSSFRSDETARPDFTLSGNVNETRDRINQSTYAFQFSLADSNHLTVWTENKIITKAGTKASVGF